MIKPQMQSFIATKKWNKIKGAFLHMIFPFECLACSHELSQAEKTLCFECQKNLPFTFFENYSEPTAMDQLFWGRVQVEYTYSLLYFEKGKSSQKILHSLKYQSNTEVGELFGQLIGERIKEQLVSDSVDLILPVPIHPKKEFVRGYNQSELIAGGISSSTGIPVNTGILKKFETTGSQTKRNRFARWDNVANNFTLNKKLKDCKHIALVDDVITTGSTIEALVRSIRQEHPDLKISIICLAMAK